MVRSRVPKQEQSPDGNLPEQVFRGLRWQVSSVGAYLLTLSDTDTDTDLLFPDRKLPNGKRRGGSFPAIPQFGDDNRGGDEPQPAHGYARIAQWSAGNLAPNKATFVHKQRKGLEYRGLCSELRYGLELGRASTKLVAELSLHNDSNRIMHIAPAMHPYIDISQLDQDAAAEIQQEYTNAQTVPIKQAVIDVGGGRELIVASEGFGYMTFWAEPDTGRFVCAEPSVNGTRFSRQPFKPTDANVLEPGEIRDYRMSLTWRQAAHRAPR